MTSRSHRRGPFSSALFLRLRYFKGFFDPIPHPPLIFLSQQHPKALPRSPSSRLPSFVYLLIFYPRSLNIFTIMYNRLYLFLLPILGSQVVASLLFWTTRDLRWSTTRPALWYAPMCCATLSDHEVRQKHEARRRGNRISRNTRSTMIQIKHRT